MQATPRTGGGHFTTRQPQATLSCEGAFPLLEQKSYQQVVGHMMVAQFMVVSLDSGINEQRSDVARSLVKLDMKVA